jgi:hypothetical protein
MVPLYARPMVPVSCCQCVQDSTISNWSWLLSLEFKLLQSPLRLLVVEVRYFLADYIFWTTFLLLLSLDLERRSDIFRYTYFKGKQE